MQSASLGIALSEGHSVCCTASGLGGILLHGTKVAEGLQSGFLQIEEVIATLKEQLQKHNETKVTIMGHSLGAVIALLAGIKLDKELE